jgi:UDP-glucuronate 4-epimerase
MERDFTYIDDLVDAIVAVMDRPPVEGEPVAECDTLSPVAPHRVLNIGGGNPVGLLDYIDVIEQALGIPVIRNFLAMQPGDVPSTSASPALLEALIGSSPQTPIATGVAEFVRWYLEYYGG